jgi:hypothetical protein
VQKENRIAAALVDVVHRETVDVEAMRREGIVGEVGDPRIFAACAR